MSKLRSTHPVAGGERDREVPSDDLCSDLEAIFDRYYARIYQYCLRRSFAKDAAEDATSVVSLRLAEWIGRLDIHNERRLRAWLYRTASNAVTTYLRAEARRNEAFAELRRQRAAGRASESDGFDRLDWPVLYEAMMKLRLDYQDIVILRFFEGLPVKEIAAILGTNPVTTRVRLLRALKELRGHLEKPFGQYVAE